MIRFILSIIGLGLTANLWISSATNAGLCEGNSGCSTVLASVYSSLMGVPLAVFGLAYFFTIFVLGVWHLQYKTNKQFYTLMAVLAVPAALVSLFLIGVQVIELQAYCWVCNLTHVVVLSLAGLGIHHLRENQEELEQVKKGSSWITPAILLLTPIVFFSLYAGYGSAGEQVVAKNKDGHRIYLSDVDAPIAMQLFDLDSQIYALRQSSIKGLVLKHQAEERGLDLNSYLQEEMMSLVAPVTDAQVAFFKKQNGPRIPKTWNDDNIRQYIMMEQSKGAQETLYQRVLTETEYKITLQEPQQKAVVVVKNPNGSLTTGDTVAPIQIIEFSDIECPYCSRAHTMLKEYQERYKGKINVTFRHFPLSFHKKAEPAARAVVCAKKQGKAWDLLDVLFANQRQLSESFVKQSVQELGLNMDDFNTCYTSDFAKETVAFDVAEANRLGVNSTPTLIINGKVHRGVPSEDKIKALLK